MALTTTRLLLLRMEADLPDMPFSQWTEIASFHPGDEPWARERLAFCIAKNAKAYAPGAGYRYALIRKTTTFEPLP